MAGTLAVVYSVLVLLVALGGMAFVYSLPSLADDESAWSRWGEFAAVAIFLVAMVAMVLVAT